MKKQLFLLTALIVSVSMILAACGSAATPTSAPATAVPAATNTLLRPQLQQILQLQLPAPTTVSPTPTLTPFPVASCQSGKTCIRWYVGLGTGTSANQIPQQQAVVDAYNASQNNVQLILEIVPNASATDVLSTEIASGNGPDIIGPVGFAGSNAFHSQWLDLTKYIAKIDTSDFNPALLKMFISGKAISACRLLCILRPSSIIKLFLMLAAIVIRPRNMAISTRCPMVLW